MQELSMNILDVAENSTRANAKNVDITLVQDTAASLQTLTIRDDGKGMSEEMLATVTDPFTTTRTTRKVGLGLPFLKMICEMTGGQLTIDSTLGKGTTVNATFTLGHIDLMPLGDMGSTLSALAAANPDTEFIYTFKRDSIEFVFNTAEAKELLGGVPLSEPEVALWVREYVNEGTTAVLEGRPPE